MMTKLDCDNCEMDENCPVDHGYECPWIEMSEDDGPWAEMREEDLEEGSEEDLERNVGWKEDWDDEAYFTILRVCREDIREILPKVGPITDDEMAEIASKLTDAIIETYYWDLLIECAERVLGVSL